jgi:predicted helicase
MLPLQNEIFDLILVEKYVYELFRLENKIDFFINTFNTSSQNNDDKFNEVIKWSEGLKATLKRKAKIPGLQKELSITFLYRPYIRRHYYAEKLLSDRLTAKHNTLFGKDFQRDNKIILLNAAAGGQKPFSVLCTNVLAPFQFFVDPTQCVSLQNYKENGEKVDNITDWGLQQFTGHYQNESIGKEDIFHYVYAVLHNPAYRKKYELNLKREFPRIPFYKDFWQWAAWGKELMDLHINYENVEPYPLKEHKHEGKAEAKRQKEIFTVAQEPEPLFGIKAKVKTKLKADKQAGIIEIDELTFLSGVPHSAWEYKLGNRSALEWILDQYKEKKPKDPTIAEKFNTYRFADYKEKVIDLLKRVCRVSVETVRVVGEMEKG